MGMPPSRGCLVLLLLEMSCAASRRPRRRGTLRGALGRASPAATDFRAARISEAAWQLCSALWMISASFSGSSALSSRAGAARAVQDGIVKDRSGRAGAAEPDGRADPADSGVI